MRATAGVCIKPVCLARSPLCHKVNLPASCEAQRLLCHKVNLPSCVARRPLFHKVNLPRCEARRGRYSTLFHVIPFHLDLWYFRHRTNKHLALCYLFGKTYKPSHSIARPSSYWNQQTRPNYWKSYWLEYTHSTEGFDDSLEMCEIERCN